MHFFFLDYIRLMQTISQYNSTLSCGINYQYFMSSQHIIAYDLTTRHIFIKPIFYFYSEKKLIDVRHNYFALFKFSVYVIIRNTFYKIFHSQSPGLAYVVPNVRTGILKHLFSKIFYYEFPSSRYFYNICV